ncbi:MAG: EamA family transporter [Nocardioides sp.]
MRRPSPIVLVLIGIVSVQLGAGVAKSLFDEVSPTVIVWLRLVTSAAVLAAYARPRLRGRTRHDWLVVLGFGASLGLMNLAIYQSFARIPLGIAVTIEFIGPLALAVLGSRRARDLLWVGLAAIGVALLGMERADLDPVGVLWALLAGAMWATYIVLSGETGRRWDGLGGLAAASVIAALLISPLLALSDSALAEGLRSPHILVLGAVVGLLSSVVPYSCELVALRSMRAATFGILMSLEPAAAALVAIIVLGELLSPLQWLAVLCVIGASIGATRERGTLAEPVPA